MLRKKICRVCGSDDVANFNSYKHHCVACKDCGSISHYKKEGKYLLEWFLPKRFLLNKIPMKLYLRLFHAPENFEPSDYYEIYAKECENPSERRISEYDQLVDQFDLLGVSLTGLRVLDVSGGPGVVAKKLMESGNDVTVTEYSTAAVDAMRNILGVNAKCYRYNDSKLNEIVGGDQFDVVLLRSSVIFCDDFVGLLNEIKQLLTPGGYVLIETIVPTLGEVFWWQQLEYKFSQIYSEQYIDKAFYKNQFSHLISYRETGSYISNKWRCDYSVSKNIFTWLLDFPMMLIYYVLAPKRKIPTNQSMDHKMLISIWTNTTDTVSEMPSFHINIKAGETIENLPAHSTHFSYVYNGFLKELKK